MIEVTELWHVRECRCPTPHGYHLHKADSDRSHARCETLIDFLVRQEEK